MFRRFLSDKTVEKRYVDSGIGFCDTVSDIMGECIVFEKLLAKWELWEGEYARRGYETVSLDDFVQSCKYLESINGKLGKRRLLCEAPKLHAKLYREKYLGKVKA